MDAKVQFYLVFFVWLVPDILENRADSSMTSTNILLPRTTCMSICRFTHSYNRCRCEEFGAVIEADPCASVKCPPGHLCKRFWIFPKCVVDPKKVCGLPKAAGPCNGIMPRYFFNVDSGKCEEFIWGGCGGNLNNFRFLRQCMFRCAKQLG
ncbi:BPTI/Kunitz domain-containing protein 4-like isoform X2 [Gigantopelta aegis]|uniref:BPTI/Kunitz domain-containing protein 4-like isoform X2 n=1 Tax=Gigantopelta aegis TaxID=1735272 RepID=UPI001B88CB9A|nr:BPTI/Kunitz domain-containing protein 4-like isoform X2 [Gigantopelta aegis]